MKLSAFRITNFRSMIDSKVTYLSSDNITTLIGKNESGKTTILEALHSFSNGTITEDILRSDSTFPVISCLFEFNGKYLKDYLNIEKVPEGLKKKLLKKKSIWLQRSWKNLATTTFTCSDTDLVDYYTEIDESFQTRIKTIHGLIQKINNETNSLRSEIQIIQIEKDDLLKEEIEAGKRLNKAERKLKRAKKPDLIQSWKHELEAANKLYTQKKTDLDAIVSILNEKKDKLSAYGEKDVLADRFLKIKEIQVVENKNFNRCNEELEYAEKMYKKAIKAKENELLADKIEQLNITHNSLHSKLLEAEYKLDFIERVAEKVLNDKNTRVAESEVKIELSKQKEFYDLEQIGEELIKHLPVFEFFEDFASLLPNRIDLSDLFDENSMVEGYKAVKNFLAISDLNPDFFNQDNDRLLKQRIENLNGEITIDFHEFWSQNIGSQNKIHLNFELEHYNSSEPKKSGEPYLEFWIKDNFERLYPKQRSRGVRWFLSFYLELKATAMSKQKKILLIDEPGLSLHAKAQQDVLKVFENLKNDLQIIYCTHSPQLIDNEKMYRILAVQRKESNNLNSESVILDSKSLKAANNETMMPLFSVLGDQVFKNQNLIKEQNLIVDDVSTFFYLSAFSKLMGKNGNIHFIPANGIKNIPMMTNILTGWRTGFSVLLPGNGNSQKILKELQEGIFVNDSQESNKRIIIMHEENVVDLLSKLDFKKHVLKKRIGIPETNNEYIEINNLSGSYLASQFNAMVDNDEIKKSDLDENSISTINEFLTRIEKSVI